MPSQPRSLPRQHRAAALFSLCEPYGGILMEQEIMDELRHSHSQPLSLLARWLVDRKVAHFTWRATVFLPRFQFTMDHGGLRALSPTPCIRVILAELDDVFDDLEQIEWFATPNTWLDLRVPAVVMSTDAAVVAEAARADRYIARGW